MTQEEIALLKGDRDFTRPITQRERVRTHCNHKTPEGYNTLTVITECEGYNILLCEICDAKVKTEPIPTSEISSAYETLEQMYQQMKIYLSEGVESKEFLDTFGDFLLILKTGQDIYTKFVKDIKLAPQVNQPGKNFFNQVNQRQPHYQQPPQMPYPNNNMGYAPPQNTGYFNNMGRGRR